MQPGAAAGAVSGGPACSDASTVSEQAEDAAAGAAASTPTSALAAALDAAAAVTAAAAAAGEGGAGSSGRGRGRRAAAAGAAAVSAAAAAEASSSKGKRKAGGKGNGGGGSRAATQAISATGHTCRGRVRQKSHKTTELVEVRVLAVLAGRTGYLLQTLARRADAACCLLLSALSAALPGCSPGMDLGTPLNLHSTVCCCWRWFLLLAGW
jgi:hypothetical protein